MLEVSSYSLPSASVSGCVPCDLSDLLDAAVSGRDRGCGCGGRGRVAGRGCGCDKARTSGTASVGGMEMSNTTIAVIALLAGAGVWWYMSK